MLGFGFKVLALLRGCVVRSIAYQSTRASVREALCKPSGQDRGKSGTFFEEEGPETTRQANFPTIAKTTKTRCQNKALTKKPRVFTLFKGALTKEPRGPSPRNH